MGWKGKIIEVPVEMIGKLIPTNLDLPESPASIFVLRNNDIGDLLIITPLFEALRRRFPSARLTAGIGDWNRDVLANNPYVTDVLPVNAPWNNKFTTPQSDLDQLRYIQHSAEVRALREQHFDVGIDILGSHVGALLLMQARIPYRLGVRGYRGGHSAMQQNVIFRDDQHVGRAALRFAELLGATDLPECRPQLFLTPAEEAAGEQRWSRRTGNETHRVVIGPGGGLTEKCWPLDSYAELAQELSTSLKAEVIVVGGKQDVEAGERIIAKLPTAKNLAGELPLRETFAVVKSADAAICNSSMLMHVAAAFCLPTVVLLGPSFDSVTRHEQQWGYPQTCRILGREGKTTEMATPQEGLDALLAFVNLR